MTETLTGVGESVDQASESSQVLDPLFTQTGGSSRIGRDTRGGQPGGGADQYHGAKWSNAEEMLTETKREVETLRDQLEQSRQEATTDALTGLLNRRAFDSEMVMATENAEMAREYLSLLMIDIDHFKRVNDTHGHLVGDKVIRFIATQLSKNVKGKDIVSRIGGEEFAILLPSTQLENARVLAESIRSRIEKSQLKRMDSSEAIGLITVSIGATCYKRGETINDFLPSRGPGALSLETCRSQQGLDSALISLHPQHHSPTEQFLQRAGPPDCVALCIIDADLTQLLQNRRILHGSAMVCMPITWPISLIDFTMAKIHRVVQNIPDKNPVDLEKVHRQVFQIVERGKTTAEIIQGKQTTPLLQGLDKSLDAG